jgi:hypothetical protein
MKRTVNKKFQLGMSAALSMIALVLGMTIVGCSEEDPPVVPPSDTPTEKTPLTGTVTVTNDITISSGKEDMKLTADVSELNGRANAYGYQWMKDGVNISGADKSTYDVKEADWGKTVRVKVTNIDHSGERYGEFTVPNPKKLILTLKWDSGAGKTDVGIVIEREDEGYWSGASTVGNLPTSPSGATITLTSWKESYFKMKTSMLAYSSLYFKLENSSGSVFFDFTDGTKTYILTNQYVTSVLYNLFATEE